MYRSLRIMLLAIAALSVAVPAAIAERGGNGNDESTSLASVSASPNPAAADSRVSLSGCGYEFKPAQVRITHSAGYTEWFSVGMWNTGCFSTYFQTAEAGTYAIDVYQSQRNTRKPMLLKSSTTLSVE